MRQIRGDRIGRTSRLVVGCSAVVFDERRSSLLLTVRADNGQWCLPSGAMEPGESVVEAAIRETKEETGLDIRIIRLVGVYSDPNVVNQYADGNRYQIIGICFEGEVIGGTPATSAETTELRFVPLTDVSSLDLLETHRARIHDALEPSAEVFLR